MRRRGQSEIHGFTNILHFDFFLHAGRWLKYSYLFIEPGKKISIKILNQQAAVGRAGKEKT
jgi:hypothetical protein